MDILNHQSSKVKELLKSLDRVENKLKDLRITLARKQWLTPNEVSSMLKVSLKTLHGYREVYGLPYSRIGDKIFFSADDLEDFLIKHKRNEF